MKTVDALARDVATLAARVVLDHGSDPRRPLPTIGSRALSRILPRLLRKAAPHLRDATKREFCENLARLIEVGHRSAPITIAEGQPS
jgi:hypothetical protein